MKRLLIVSALFVVIVAISGGLWVNFNTSDSHTKYSWFYSEMKFNSVRIGDDEKEVIRKIGRPMEIIPLDPAKRGKIYYYSNPKYVFKDPEPVTIRRFHLVNGKVQKIIKRLGTAWDDESLGLTSEKFEKNISSDFYLCYDGALDIPYSITRRSKGRESVFSIHMGKNEDYKLVSYFRLYGKFLYMKVYQFKEDISFRGLLGDNDMVDCINWNLSSISHSDLYCFDIELQQLIKTRDKGSFYFMPIGEFINLREKPDLNAAIIRKVTKNEKLELLNWETTEAVYRVAWENYIRGSWLQCRTADGTIGWCFDGFLELKQRGLM